MEPVVRRFLVHGKVQGVFFRHSARVEAERLAIRGIARNLPDGSVEVIARGTPPAIQELRVWLHRGRTALAGHLSECRSERGNA